MKPSMTQKRDRTRPRPPGLAPKEIAHRDRLREVALKWMGKPPGMPKALAQKFEREAKGGKTIKDLTDINSKSYIVPNSRFRKHCDLNPAWGKRMYRLSAANSGKKKSANSKRGVATRKMCLRGLHPMKGHNLMLDINDGRPRRRCRACFTARLHGKPMTAEMMERLKTALRGGASLGEILWGRPMGGGPKDRSLAITTPGKFYHQRRVDPDFDAFVEEHIADSNSRGFIARQVRTGLKKKKSDAVLPPELRPTIVVMAAVRGRLRALDPSGKLAKKLEDQRRRSDPEKRDKMNAAQREQRRRRRNSLLRVKERASSTPVRAAK
jgi:hypothetical protein